MEDDSAILADAAEEAGEKQASACALVTAAPDGAGPLLERDYWTVIRNARLRPPEIAKLVAERFWTLCPAELACFRRTDGTLRPLDAGDDMEVEIRKVGSFGVRVIHKDRNSLTVATLEGHPEAGRITFGAYPNERGDVVFHIRSRARAASKLRYVGFVALGDAMQTNTWTGFINAVATEAGDGLDGPIHVEKRRVEEESGDEAADGPTFIARGD